MSVRDLSEQEIFERFKGVLRNWLCDSDGTHIGIDHHTIHQIGFITNWLTINGRCKDTLLPAKMDFTMNDLHPAQVDPRRSAWLCSHLWMDAFDNVLHQESDWMHEPVINGDPAGNQDVAVELGLHLRDPEFVPEWMATKAAAFRKKEETRA